MISSPSWASVGLMLDNSFTVNSATSSNTSNTSSQNNVTTQSFAGTSGKLVALDTTKFANGTHQLKAVAYDASGASRSDLISINIQNAAVTPTPTFRSRFARTTRCATLC